MKQAKRTRGHGEAGFTLIETLITVGIILLIIGIAVPSYLSARKSGAQTAAAGNVKTMGSNAALYQSHNGGFPLLAANMAGAEVATTVASTCLADEEIYTGDGTATGAGAWDAGFVQSGFKFTFKANGTSFVTAQCGATTNVAPVWDAIASPTDPSQGNTNYCIDSGGLEFQAPYTGATVVATGVGCGGATGDLGTTAVPVQ